MMAHLSKLQDIANANNGTRAVGTPGYEDTVDYVVKTLRDKGFNVQTPEFSARVFHADKPAVTVGGKTVDFLRTGRVALMYQTLDGRETGYWDAGSKQWHVDAGYEDAVRAGLKIAKKQSAPDFLTVAVPAPKEIS